MKKLGAAFAITSVVAIGAFTTNVSAAEHEVQKNDSLWAIAQQYDTSVEQLVEANSLDSTIIHPGQMIYTEKETKQAAATDDSDNEEIYKVEKGDTLSGVSLKYGVTVNEIQKWNDLSSSIIVIGQDLKLKDIEANQTKDTSNAKKKSTTNTESKKESVEVSNDKEQETVSVTATAYTAKCEGCTGVTATGIDLNKRPNKKVIAVDPNVIPLGSEVYVEGYGKAIAGDVGAAIKGKKIDIHVPTKAEANRWGVQTVDVTVLN